ncbi:hypothetical protein [Serratia sp. M24T3]|uniref:hypothetical protein n=1 Tax=Serratia sp. M24T3 TaxID=932213 RepID=UPI00025BB668|nr:hypothetical protein [Serratia sp. M24T3]EIC83365.1 hypothetical protein SPM24T3_17180 [Serratia sp. M24T3]
MANYLFGDFYAGTTVTSSCYAYITSVGASDGASYPLVITVYSDADQKTAIYSRTDMLLEVLGTVETEENKELRALRIFNSMLAPQMSLVSDS